MADMSIKYEHDYYHAGAGDMVAGNIPEMIGKADASDEWTNALAADANFINIESYNKFADTSCVFLVGRIGSGKTTMLNKMKYSIESEKEKRYNSVVMIDTRDYIAQLASILRVKEISGSTYSEIEYVARKEWEKAIYILVMEALYKKYGQSYPNNFQKIRSYLKDNGYLSSKYSMDLLSKICSNLGKFGSVQVKNVTTAIETMAMVMSTEFDEALEEMYEVLGRHGKMLVLIDSIEKYEFKDTIMLAVLNALVNLCVEVTRDNRNLLLKMAAPSELIPQLMSINPEKISSKIVYIRWSHDDLKSFLAVRVYRYVNKIPEEEYVNRKEAISFFNDYYEEYCMTRCNFKFPTFSYCLSYTQKEPRQLLAIYNAWLFFENKFCKKQRMDLVEMAITNDEIARIKGALSIYSNIHPQMFEMFKRTFNTRKYCFSEREFDEWLNACSNIRGNVDAYDLKKYFISSGLVGVMIEMHEIRAEDNQLNPGRNIRIKEVLFEYQYKECLPFNSETKFCLHPMVFGALNIEVDRNTFVYPKPIEADSEFIPWLNS